MLPGNERDSTAFRAALEVARAAQLTLTLTQTLTLTLTLTLGRAGGAAAVCAVPPHPADGALSRRRRPERHGRTREDAR